jgi:hypothetical protein
MATMMQNGGSGRDQDNNPPGGGNGPPPKGHYNPRYDLPPPKYNSSLKVAGVGPDYNSCLTCLQRTDSKHRSKWMGCSNCPFHGAAHVGDPCPYLRSMNDTFWESHVGRSRSEVYTRSKSGPIHKETRREKKEAARRLVHSSNSAGCPYTPSLNPAGCSYMPSSYTAGSSHMPSSNPAGCYYMHSSNPAGSSYAPGPNPAGSQYAPSSYPAGAPYSAGDGYWAQHQHLMSHPSYGQYGSPQPAYQHAPASPPPPAYHPQAHNLSHGYHNPPGLSNYPPQHEEFGSGPYQEHYGRDRGRSRGRGRRRGPVFNRSGRDILNGAPLNPAPEREAVKKEERTMSPEDQAVVVAGGDDTPPVVKQEDSDQAQEAILQAQHAHAPAEHANNTSQAVAGRMAELQTQLQQMATSLAQVQDAETRRQLGELLQEYSMLELKQEPAADQE